MRKKICLYYAIKIKNNLPNLHIPEDHHKYPKNSQVFSEDHSEGNA